MSKHLPNNVVVVAMNVPGAGGRKGAAYLYRSKADVYTIGAFNIPDFAIPQFSKKNRPRRAVSVTGKYQRRWSGETEGGGASDAY